MAAAAILAALGVAKPPGPRIDGKLRSNGIRLFDDRGPWRWKMATAFDALRLVCLGEDAKVTAYGRWVKSVGGNGLRVFCNWSVTGLDFRIVPGYFDKVFRLCNLSLGEGLRLELCAVVDYIPPQPGEQQDFIDKVAAVAAQFDHVCVTFGNEPYKNMSDPEQIEPPDPDLPMSRGMSNPNDPASHPYLPSAGFTSYQTVRSADWYRKVGKDGYEIHHGYAGTPLVVPDFPGTHDATINTEMMGASERYIPGARSNRPDEFFTAGVAAGLFTSGATGHGDSLTMQRCVVPGQVEGECIRQLFRGIDIVPIDAPTWAYTRYGLGDDRMPVEPDPVDVANGTDIRIHSMVGQTQAASVNYHYIDDGHEVWRPQGVNGWRTVLQDGPYVLSERA